MQSNTILYIEDSPLNIRLVQKMLKEHDYNVVGEYHGLSGIKRAIVDSPKLILIDIHLPDMSGLEVVRQLREHEMTADIPMIALTADNSNNMQDRCLEAGFSDYLNKPIERSTLIETIESYVKACASCS